MGRSVMLNLFQHQLLGTFLLPSFNNSYNYLINNRKIHNSRYLLMKLLRASQWRGSHQKKCPNKSWDIQKIIKWISLVYSSGNTLTIATVSKPSHHSCLFSLILLWCNCSCFFRSGDILITYISIFDTFCCCTTTFNFDS